MFYRMIIDSWNDALLLFDKITHKDSNWAFRGQSDESWELSTKFEREANKYQLGDIEPFQQHERISIQQGLFLFPGNIERPFAHNLCSVFEFDFKDLSAKNAFNIKFSEIDNLVFSDISIIKIVIPSMLHSKTLCELHKMNVTAATLFPGLDGFARSLSFRFRELDYFFNCE